MVRGGLKKHIAPIQGAEYVDVAGIGLIPVMSIPVMSDEKERELARQSAQRWKEAQEGR